MTERQGCITVKDGKERAMGKRLELIGVIVGLGTRADHVLGCWEQVCSARLLM